jgi:hypothetical protein
MRDSRAFDSAVRRFLKVLQEGDSIEALWEEILDEGDLNDADLQRAVQRAEDLEAEADGTDWG